jgi:hypothetical protein
MNSTLKQILHIFLVAIMAAVVLALVGCAGPRYHNPDKTDQEWHADVADCQSKAYSTNVNAVFQHQIFDSCMKGKGWVRAD